MELKEFIKTTLTEIVEAVKETQETVKDMGATIVPTMPHAIATKTICVDENNLLISQVDFNVAVTAGSSNTLNGDAKAGIRVLSTSIKGQTEERNEVVSRVAFSIPVILPATTILSDRQKDRMRKEEEHHQRVLNHKAQTGTIIPEVLMIIPVFRDVFSCPPKELIRDTSYYIIDIVVVL